MTGRIESRRIIIIPIIGLALLTLSLAAILAWNAYTKRVEGQRLLRVNGMADKIIKAASILAVERGLTSAALGAGTTTPDIKRELVKLRARSDALWKEINITARALANELSAGHAFSFLFERNAHAYRTLQEARRRVDAGLATRRGAISRAEWMKVSIRHIATAARLREAAFAGWAGVHEVAQLNITLKHRIWLVSEYAGMERGTLVYFVAARRPVPAEVVDELKSLRGVVLRNVEDILSLKQLPGSNAKILRAIEGMERNFLGPFDTTRAQIYAAVDSGNYPLTAEQWWSQATSAVESILGVVAAVTEIVEKAPRGWLSATSNCLFYILLFLAPRWWLRS